MDLKKARAAAKALVAQMTTEECASQLTYASKAIERLGIHEYNWWNEALHGVARAGTATVFPQAIGLAATFSPEAVQQCAEAIAEEGRAKYNQSVSVGDRDIFKGLTYWSPNINIFRDPRWGRGQETYGEDPFLTASIGCAFIKGLQGDGEFLKAAACAKHFAVHSGPESLRHSFDAKVSRKDLYETYLPAFEWAVKRAGVIGVMGAYNRVNGEPCCASEHLLREILLEDWGFDGYVVSDCGAPEDIYKHHHYVATAVEAAAIALKCGVNISCGKVYAELMNACQAGLISEEDIRAAAIKAFTVRYLLCEFEDQRPYAEITYSALDSEAHQALNLALARESLVLLKNDGILPLDERSEMTIAAVGPNVMNITALEGNYEGRASEYITVADGLRRVFTHAKLSVEEGSQLIRESLNHPSGFGNLRSAGVAAARHADLTVLCLGLDRTVEGEEMAADKTGYGDRGDRTTVYLPQTQQKLAEEVCDACEHVIVVVLAGSPVDLGEKVRAKARAIIHAWYPGARGGLAIAELLAGRFSPSGRLPITFPYGDMPLPDFTDYAMTGRTYRYMTEKPLYPFGYGLSYSKAVFSHPRVKETAEGYAVTVTVKNDGDRDTKVPVQIYAHYTDSACETPLFQLCAVRKVALAAGECLKVTLDIDRYWISAVDADGRRHAPDGELTFFIGDRQPDRRSDALSDTETVSIKIK